MMDKSIQRYKTMALLVEAGIAVFEEKGIAGASIRDVTGRAHLADGILNKWFGNKERLGAYVYAVLLRHVNIAVDAVISIEDDPVFYALTTLYTQNIYLMAKWGYRQFTIDALKHDLPLNYLMKKPDIRTVRLIRQYKSDADEEKISLYSEYIPYMLGRTITLKKQDGFFKSIPYEDIPLLICLEALRHFVADDEIRGRAGEALRTAQKLCEEIPHRPSMEMIEGTVQEIAMILPPAH